MYMRDVPWDADFADREVCPRPTDKLNCKLILAELRFPGKKKSYLSLAELKALSLLCIGNVSSSTLHFSE